MKNWLVLIFAFVLVAVTGARSQGKAQAQPEQTYFSAEDGAVNKPVAIPRDVMAILRREDLVRNVLENEGIPPEKLPQSWFSASAIHLNGPVETDLIVVAEATPLAGANTVTFWVFCPVSNGYELVLTAPAHDLVVKKKRSMGYRDIEILGATAVVYSSVLFRWDGARYSKFREESHGIP